MPKSNSTADKTPANKQKGKKQCTCCHKEKRMTEFYLSYSPMYSLDKRVPVCKECCKNSCLNDNGSIDFEKLKELLRNIDKPLYYDLISSAEESIKKENSYLSDEDLQFKGYDILSKYFTLVAMRQDRAKSYSDSEKEGFMHTNNNRKNSEKKDIIDKFRNVDKKIKDNEKIYSLNDDFIVTQDMIDLFGEGYTPLEYKKMTKKYKEMSKTYVMQTSIHKEALVTYVRFKVKEEIATAKGEVTDAQKWYSAAQNAAEQGKLTAKQISKEDLQGGLVNFSDIFSAVEGAKERIKIFPEFKYNPKDAADFIIWCYINYERNLNNMPEVDYKDIYAFYDRKKQEYIETYGDPYGIFTEDTTEENRPIVEKFITVPRDQE
ncbi:hypothetical protein F140042L4_21230 [Coprococcus phoceensis]